MAHCNLAESSRCLSPKTMLSRIPFIWNIRSGKCRRSRLMVTGLKSVVGAGGVITNGCRVFFFFFCEVNECSGFSGDSRTEYNKMYCSVFLSTHMKVNSRDKEHISLGEKSYHGHKNRRRKVDSLKNQWFYLKIDSLSFDIKRIWMNIFSDQIFTLLHAIFGRYCIVGFWAWDHLHNH